ncbi:MAG: 3'(2'),5'-bisphosphate nucleotidase CysQ [Proteobacteria bacterium]|nr:3'(2'),5'-bisphosphate nucleotidase CysQ [Pseudomonadota bacterium]
MNPSELLDRVAAIARRAGALILEVYGTDFAVAAKSDASPVTLADERAEALIVAELERLDPATPIVAEEAVAAGRVPSIERGRFWLVDPLDGTREFVARNGEFTVNIALVEHGRPVLGVVHAPALGRTYAGAVGAVGAVGASGGKGAVGAAGAAGASGAAWMEDAAGRRPIRCRTPPPAGLTVVASRSHGDAQALERFLAGRRVASLASAGSSLKLCLVAAGEADLYPRLGRTMEWDIAAGHAIVAAAGGQVSRIDDGTPLAYGKPGFDNPHFVASGLSAQASGRPPDHGPAPLRTA